MVSGIAGELSCKLIFYLANGDSFSFNSADDINKTNYIVSLKLEEKLSENSYLPVGVNSGSVLDIEGESQNHALIPENKNSMYYGYMNNTCYIELYITENETEHFFGKYFVNSWKSSITDKTPNRFVINATNLMGVISKCNVPDVDITSGMRIKDYFENVIVNLNNQLDSNKKIGIRSSDINFDYFPTMYFCNIDTTNIDNCFNNISQATLTNIFIDRAGYIKTDNCLDDTPQEAQYRLDLLVSGQVGTGTLVNYDGVKISYTLGDIKDSEVIASVYDHTINTSDHILRDISLGDAVYKINRIDVIPDTDGVFVGIRSASYNKNKITLDLDVDTQVKININVYGQRIDNTLLIKEYGGDNKLEITNTIITRDLVDKYMNNIIKLIELKNNSLTLEAYLKPDIKLSDVIYVNATGAMSVSGYYKVQAITWNLGIYSKCTIKLVKTFESGAPDIGNVGSNLQSQLTLLLQSATEYTNVDSSLLDHITQEDNKTYMSNNTMYNSTSDIYNRAMEEI